MKLKLLFSLVVGTSSLSIERHDHGRTPTVTLRNGTYKGVYSNQYNQDLFLGIPFAQPPTGHLRFRNPKPLESSWKGEHNATEFSPACVGYGVSARLKLACKASLRMIGFTKRIPDFRGLSLLEYYPTFRHW